MSVYVPKVHNPGVYGRFYGLNIKREMVVLEHATELARLITMKKKPQIRRPKGRTLDTHATYRVNCCQGKVAGVIL